MPLKFNKLTKEFKHYITIFEVDFGTLHWHCLPSTSMAAALPSLPAFDISEVQNSSAHWKKWLQRFENFITVLDIKDDTRIFT